MITFDAKFRKEVQKELKDAALAIAKKYGIEVDYDGGAKYSTETYTLKLQFKTAAAEEKKAEHSNLIGNLYFGLPKDIVGKSFVSKGEKLTVIEINTRRPKNPVSLVSSEGKKYKCSAEYVKSFIKD